MLARTRPSTLSSVFGPMFGNPDRDFNSMFESLFGTQANTLRGGFNMDVQDKGDSVVLSADLPGISKDEVEVTVDNGVLTISGERRTSHEERDEDLCISERSFGKFSRSLQLPGEIDASSIDAALKDGVLTVTLQKKEDVRPRKVSVK